MLGGGVLVAVVEGLAPKYKASARRKEEFFPSLVQTRKTCITGEKTLRALVRKKKKKRCSSGAERGGVSINNTLEPCCCYWWCLL